MDYRANRDPPAPQGNLAQGARKGNAASRVLQVSREKLAGKGRREKSGQKETLENQALMGGPRQPHVLLLLPEILQPHRLLKGRSS